MSRLAPVRRPGDARRRGSVPLRPGVGGLAAIALFLVVTACTGPADGPATAEPSPASTTAAPSTSETPPTRPTIEVAAYYFTDTGAGPRLARGTGEGSGDPLRASLEAMIAGASDPDYYTLWNPDTRVLDARLSAGTITVDLSPEARQVTVDSGSAQLMVQQLVYTATEAAGEPDARVILLIDGATPGAVWDGVSWDDAVERADPVEVRSRVQLDVPQEGADVTSKPVTVTGQVAAGPGSRILWTVRDAGGSDVASGALATPGEPGFTPFTFDVELPPGRYSVEVSLDDPALDPAVDRPTDTRTFAVHLAA